MAVTLARLWGYLWAAPCSALGLLAAGVVGLFGASAQWQAGVLEVHPVGTRHAVPAALRRVPFTCITLGHVVLAVSRAELQRLRLHERAHVAQYERWGPALWLAYPLASLFQWARGGRAYHDNCFEVQARAAERGPGAASNGLPD